MSTVTIDQAPAPATGLKEARQAVGVFEQLARRRYVVVRTFRRNGKAVDTPVWFAIGAGKLYVYTEKYSGKVKRIRNGSRVQMVPSTPTGRLRGPFHDVVARMLGVEEQSLAQQLLRARYGWMIRGFERWWAWRGHEHVYLELVPLNDPAPGLADP